MRPFKGVLFLLVLAFGLGFGLAWAANQDVEANPNTDTSEAAFPVASIQMPGIKSYEEKIKEPETECEYHLAIEAAENKMENLLLAVKFFIPGVTILSNQNGVICFIYPGSKLVYSLETKNVEKVLGTVPADYAKIRPEDLLKSGIVSALNQEETWALAATLPINPETGPAAESVNAGNGAENKTCNLVLACKFYLPRASIYSSQNGIIHFRSAFNNQVYGIENGKVEAILKTVPEKYLQVKIGVLSKNELISPLDNTNDPDLPESRSLISGYTRHIQNCLTLEPVGLVFGLATLEYERMLGRDFSIAAGYKFNQPSRTYDFADDVGPTLTYWGWQGSLRYYPLKKFYAPRGLWFGPTFEHVNKYYDDYHALFQYTNVLAEAGFKFILVERWGMVVSPFLGLGYSWCKGDAIKRQDCDPILPSSGIAFVLGCAVGLGF
jgi:hypothetical protein